MNTSTTHAAPWWQHTLSQLGRDLTYLLPLLPIVIASFVVSITLAAVAVSTAIIWVGVPLGAFTLVTASGFALLERKRLSGITTDAPISAYSVAPASASRVRRLLYPYTDMQRWRDLLYAIIDFPVAVIVWCVTIVWVAASLMGPTVWIWHQWVPENTDDSVPILNWLNSLGGQTTLGLFALVTLPWVARGLALIQQGMGGALLGASEAQQLRAKVSHLESRGRAAASAEAQALRKIERDLHDGPQQRLVRLAMDVQQAEATFEANPTTARLALASERDQGAQALAELRQLTRGIAPPILVERGLAAALESLAERGTLPIEVDVALECELGVSAETTLYFVASEALANVAKHSQASQASITVRVAEGMVAIVIADDGIGGAHPSKGHGLAGLADRVEGVGGTLTVTDAPGGGTIVTAEVACG